MNNMEIILQELSDVIEEIQDMKFPISVNFIVEVKTGDKISTKTKNKIFITRESFLENVEEILNKIYEPINKKQFYERTVFKITNWITNFVFHKNFEYKVIALLTDSNKIDKSFIFENKNFSIDKNEEIVDK